MSGFKINALTAEALNLKNENLQIIYGNFQQNQTSTDPAKNFFLDFDRNFIFNSIQGLRPEARRTGNPRKICMYNSSNELHILNVSVNQRWNSIPNMYSIRTRIRVENNLSQGIVSPIYDNKNSNHSNPLDDIEPFLITSNDSAIITLLPEHWFVVEVETKGSPGFSQGDILLQIVKLN